MLNLELLQTMGARTRRQEKARTQQAHPGAATGTVSIAVFNVHMMQ